ncbi:uncharacterized protein LOC134837118 [Culicoides brevitarsis]|uniref:uncharacterized protein LOC134837118 n=1 Tax=Culicoides brevitarsis TaxID=469753 RepID=UPI00307BBC3B
MVIPIDDSGLSTSEKLSQLPPHTQTSFDTDPGLKLEIQEFVGNHKEFRIETNLIHLRIIGNNNRVILKCNFGKLDVIGHATKVKIHSNSGKINYVGNNGKIYLGRGSKVTNVNYTGNQGSVKLLENADFNTQLRRSNRSSSCDKINRIAANNEKRQKTSTPPPVLPPSSSSSHSHPSSSSVVLINVKNNISLPNIDDLSKATEQKLSARTSFKISNSSTDICVNNFFRKRCT